MSQAQFDFLLPAFSHIYQEAQQQRYEDGVKTGKRSRKSGAGIKGKLPTMADKLLFVLSYYKTYPTFDVLGAQFDMVRSKANEKTGVDQVILDATERTCRRSQDDATQREHYSGKKKTIR